MHDFGVNLKKMETRRFRDARGKEIEVAGPPQRVVCFIPSLTETLFSLGLEGRIVGVSRYCKYPPEKVAAVARIGGIHDADREKILSLKADLVIANMEENKKEDVEYLESEGLRVYVTFPKTLDDLLFLIGELGEMMGTRSRAEEIIREARREYEETLSRTKDRRRVRVFYPVWRRPYYSINADTFIHHMITVCGGENIFADREKRYFPVSLEEVAERKPELILLPSEPYVFKEAHKKDFTPYPDIPAVSQGKLLLVDGELVCWYGVRSGKGLRYLREILQGL